MKVHLLYTVYIYFKAWLGVEFTKINLFNALIQMKEVF